MLFALFWGNKQLDFVGKNDQSHAIVILNCGKGEQSANLGTYLAFHLRHRSKVSRRTRIDHQYHGEFALFVEHLDKRVIHTRCHVPVNCANIIAGLIFSHFCKRHTPAFKYRMVFASENRVHQIARAQLNAFDFFEDFSWNHLVSYFLSVWLLLPVHLRSSAFICGFKALQRDRIFGARFLRSQFLRLLPRKLPARGGATHPCRWLSHLRG